MTSQLTERNKKIIELSRTHNMTEISEMMDISRERVRQILEMNCVTERNFLRHDVSENVKKIKPLLGTMTDVDIARLVGVEQRLVFRVRKNLEIKKYVKPIGCERCKTNPYAKGLCRNCYGLMLRRGDSNGTD